MSPATLEGHPLRAALRQRLETVAPLLGIVSNLPESTADLIEQLARRVRSADAADAWLLFVAIAGAFPTTAELADLRRRLDLAPPGAAIVAVLTPTVRAAARASERPRHIEVVDGGIVVDVHFSAAHEHNTGIQRVVRQTMPAWVDQHDSVDLVAWTTGLSAFRPLDETERDRVLRWNDRSHPTAPDTEDSAPETIVVPWRSRIVVPEVPAFELCDRLTCLAQFSGNRMSLIGYDAIPIVSADMVVEAESERFAHYLAIVKHADRIVCISESSAEEFRGFVSVLPAQGLTGPVVDVVSLPAEVPVTPPAAQPDPAVPPLVLCVGSHEARKNQDAVLFAAEILHAEGVAFRLVFVGAGSVTDLARFEGRVRRLQRAGLDVSTRRRLPDAELWQLYADARFSVFVSLHEGYGLPVVESLALGTPVVTSNFGSLAEVASGGGCVAVDPRDDAQILDAMRALLTDDRELERLHAEIAARRFPGWADYASELWTAAVERREA